MAASLARAVMSEPEKPGHVSTEYICMGWRER